jgi:hypothetical protein
MAPKIILTWSIVIATLLILDLKTALCQYSEIWNSGNLGYPYGGGISWNNDVENSADVNGDNISDLWITIEKGMKFYDGINFNLIWQLTTTYTGIYSVGLADTDGDGALERIFLEGSSNPSVGRIRIYDNVTHSLEWQSEEIDGLSSAYFADIKGDGKSEVMITTRYPDQDSCVVYVYEYTGSGVGEENQGENRPEKNRLSQNYPNPFNTTTSIKYELQTVGKATISIFNSLGQLVRILFNGKQPEGEYSIVWDGKNDQGKIVASGIYFYQIKINSYTSSKN